MTYVGKSSGQRGQIRGTVTHSALLDIRPKRFEIGLESPSWKSFHQNSTRASRLFLGDNTFSGYDRRKARSSGQRRMSVRHLTKGCQDTRHLRANFGEQMGYGSQVEGRNLRLGLRETVV